MNGGTATTWNVFEEQSERLPILEGEGGDSQTSSLIYCSGVWGLKVTMTHKS